MLDGVHEVRPHLTTVRISSNPPAESQKCGRERVQPCGLGVASATMDMVMGEAKCYFAPKIA
jgi:hypothetical protein